jgi:lysine-N-methylase
VELRTVSVPAFLRRFRCIGPACESSCCGGWRLPVDRASCERYEQLDDPQLAAALQANIIPNEQPTNTTEWAHLRQRDDTTCPFLSEERLCELQLQRGLDFLPLTCATYPRVSICIDGSIERTATLSCPEAARLALLDPGAMKQLRQKEPATTRDALAADIVTSTAAEGDPMALFGIIRQRTIKLLRQRRFSIEARLAAMAGVFSSLSEAMGEQSWAREDHGDRLSSNQRLFQSQVEQAFTAEMKRLAAIQGSLCGAKPDVSLPVRILGGLNAEQFFGPGVSGRYLELVRRIRQGLAAEPYAGALTQLYQPYMARRPHVVENLLINHVYATSFPFVTGQSLYDQYLLLASQYLITKWHLVGLAAAEGRLTDALLVELVHLLRRAVEHTPPYQAQVLDLMREHDIRTLLA